MPPQTDAQHFMDFLVEVGRIPASPLVAATLVRIAEPPPKIEAAMGHSDAAYRGEADYLKKSTGLPFLCEWRLPAALVQQSSASITGCGTWSIKVTHVRCGTDSCLA
ncbi:hypothetical protein PIB30_058153 [Stylosanthes scabra]|uniref:Uncharacterized protein n=1 Tax=Stylosanthes scabra TaxID=79078 RepID=A0ABU6ZIJ9_9FABA|nr:hypothetical protein [Stylosanthes scabra]